LFLAQMLQQLKWNLHSPPPDTAKMPVTPRPKIRHAFSDLDCFTDRSADSGYGSVECSPEKFASVATPETPTIPRLVDLYDGNGSEASFDLDSGNCGDVSGSSPTGHGRDQRATLPRGSVRHRPALSASLFRRTAKRVRRRGSDTSILSTPDSLRSLDRFVPTRDPSTPSSQKFRTTKDPGELTPTERLLRHNRHAPDPFCYRRRSASILPTSELGNLGSPDYILRSGTVLSPVSQNDHAGTVERDRQVSSLLHICGATPSTSRSWRATKVRFRSYRYNTYVLPGQQWYDLDGWRVGSKPDGS